jgi:hypothetical protein
MTLYYSGTSFPVPGDGEEPTWSGTAYGRWRLNAEIEAMKRFPDFSLEVPGVGCAVWTGVLRCTFWPCRRYSIRVVYPDYFPHVAPVVYIDRPSLAYDTPHLLSRSRPCLYADLRHVRHGYDPARTTAATLVAWTALWIHAYETWQATGTWPGKEA